MPISIEIEPLNRVQQQDEHILARFLFSETSDDAKNRCEYDCETGMPQLGHESVSEVWRVSGVVRRTNQGRVRLSISEDYCLASIELPVEVDKIKDISRQSYDLIFDAIQDKGFPHIVKTWNYVPDITGGGEDDAENYKQFCFGRALSYSEKGLTGDCMPAGTAVGVGSKELLRIYVLCSKHSVVPLENPRQTSAYRYPRQFGPKSPSFSRAVRLETDLSKQFFLSGTASIVGHVSKHLGDVPLQVLETLENISSLLNATNNDAESTDVFSLTNGVYRLHLKEEGDVETALLELEKSQIKPEQIIIVKADICRRELLLEIDGVLGLTSSKFQPHS